MRTPEDNLTLWRVLDGVTEFEHEWEAVPNGITKDQHRCKKCRRYTPTEGLRVKSPCPEVPQYPGSDADVAEKIRAWIEKSDVKTRVKYIEKVIGMASDSRCFETMLPPAQKIKAFTSIHKETER